MKSTEILIILVLVGAAAWFGFSKKGENYNFATPHQHQIDKANALQGQIQSAADRQEEQLNKH